jgi:hypothetical protein
MKTAGGSSMILLRGLIASGIIAVLLMFVVRCASTSIDSGSSEAEPRATRHAQAAAGQTAAAMKVQNQIMQDGAPQAGKLLGTVAPGETWQGTVTVKLGPESFSLDRSGASGMRRYGDLRLKLLGNQWQEHGVTGRVHSVRVDQYRFDIWQLEKDGKLMIPSPADQSLDMETLGRLSRQEVAQLRWLRDPRRDGFDPEWDLRRGQGSAHRATIVLSITAPGEVVWAKGRQDRSDGDLSFGSQYSGVGLMIGLRYDASTGGFLIKEGSFMGGRVVANPHHARFADAW